MDNIYLEDEDYIYGDIGAIIKTRDSIIKQEQALDKLITKTGLLENDIDVLIEIFKKYGKDTTLSLNNKARVLGNMKDYLSSLKHRTMFLKKEDSLVYLKRKFGAVVGINVYEVLQTAEVHTWVTVLEELNADNL